MGVVHKACAGPGQRARSTSDVWNRDLESLSKTTIRSESLFGGGSLWRSKVPGGWIIRLAHGEGLAFYPDPEHKWDGNSLP
jgi:hypothetical protein